MAPIIPSNTTTNTTPYHHRSLTLKRQLVESKADPLTKALLAECRAIEKENYVPTSFRNLYKQDFVPSGIIEMRQFATFLSQTPLLQDEMEKHNLSFLQATILISAVPINDHATVISHHVTDYFSYS